MTAGEIPAATATEALERLPEAFFALDTDWRFTYLNRRALDLFNRSADDLIGVKIWDEYPDLVGTTFAEHYRTVMADRQAVRFEALFEPADRWFEVRAYPSEGGLSVYFRDVTEQYRQERRRMGYETVFDELDDAVWIIDADRTLLFVNRPVSTVLNESSEEIIGEDYRDRLTAIFPEEDQAETYVELVESVLSGERDVGSLGFALDVGDVQVDLDIRITPIDYDADQRGAVIVGRDVSELKQRERELERYREYTETIFDSMRDGFFVIDANADLKRWNRVVTDDTGYTDEEVASMNAIDFVPDEQTERVARNLMEVLETGHTTFEADLVSKDGDPIPFEFIASLLEDPDGNPVIAGIGRDITDRKEREQELERTKRRLETVFDTVQAAIFLKDTEGRYLMTNQWGRDLVGVESAEEAIGLTNYDLFPEELADQIEEWDREIIDSGETLEVEVEIPTVESRRVVHSIGTPIRDDSGTIQGLCAVATDVTDAKEREERLKLLSERLSLINRIVRHDIRNDMNVAIGWTQELEPHLDEEGSSMLERIQSTHEHVVDLTKVVRDFVNALGSETETDLDPTDLGFHLQQAIDKRRTTYPEATFAVHGTIPDVSVRANELLSSVFRNVLNNAVQHNDKTDPIVDVSVEQSDEWVTVRIADNGPGIPEERRDAIFGRGEAGIDDPAAGIGLYLVRTLVDQYGGNVTVEDNDPEGAVFVIELPRWSDSTHPEAIQGG